MTNDIKGDGDGIIKADLYEPIVVLELFTSQGCSSCPAADALLNKVKENDEENVFVLSYHVDYWNYIGWDDPFSKSQFAEKQRLYNSKFNYRSNYTPQMVVNGKAHFVGSQANTLQNKISTYKNRKSANEIHISGVAKNDRMVTFNFKVDGDLAGKNIRAVLVLDERTTQVKRGENRNRTLTNSNIVVSEKISQLNSAEGELTLEIPGLVKPSDTIRVVALVENDVYDITGATKSTVKG